MPGETEDFKAVIRQVAAARKWGAADAASVLARGDRGSLTNVIGLALDSDHAEANAYALAASEALLKVEPDWEGSYYFRGKALVKTGKPAEAIPLHEKALGMTTDRLIMSEITLALGKARAAVKAAGAAAQPAPGPK